MGNPIDIVFSQVPMISSWTILSLAVWTLPAATRPGGLSAPDGGWQRVLGRPVLGGLRGSWESGLRYEGAGRRFGRRAAFRRCRKTWGELVMNATGNYGYVWNRLSWDICCGEAWRGYPQNPPRNGDRWISLGENPIFRQTWELDQPKLISEKHAGYLRLCYSGYQGDEVENIVFWGSNGNWGTFLRGFNQSFRFSGQHDSGPREAFLKQALLKKMQLQDPDSFLIFWRKYTQQMKQESLSFLKLHNQERTEIVDLKIGEQWQWLRNSSPTLCTGFYSSIWEVGVLSFWPMYGSHVNMISSGIPQVKSRGITTHEVEHFAELGWFGLVYGCLYTQVSVFEFRVRHLVPSLDPYPSILAIKMPCLVGWCRVSSGRWGLGQTSWLILFGREECTNRWLLVATLLSHQHDAESF